MSSLNSHAEPLLRPISMVGGIVCGLLVAITFTGTSWAQPPMGPSPVEVTAARELTASSSVRLPGTVRARTRAVIASDVAGSVSEVLAREGDRVDRGQPLIRLRRQRLELDLDSARGRLQEAEARLAQADQKLQRADQLFDGGVISRQQLDDARSEQQAWSGRASDARAAIEGLRDDLERSTVRAPFAGVVIAEHVEVGEWLTVGGPVAELLDSRRLEVEVALPARHFAELRQGSTVTVYVPSSPGLQLTGQVSAIVPSADPRTRTFPVKVTVDNTEGAVGVGMAAEVALPTGSARQVVAVPKDALVPGPTPTVVVIRSDRANSVEVETGVAIGAWIEVTSIAIGDLVVVRGNERLFDGAEVVATERDTAAP